MFSIFFIVLFSTSVLGRLEIPEKPDVSENVIDNDGAKLKRPLSDIKTGTNDSTPSNAGKVKLTTNENALKLTPFIKSGLLEQARNASEVNSTLFLGHKSYSGYLTVNEQYNSNTFFWYFPVEDKPVEETPWIIWLQGGPGSSSMYGLFNEIGPFTVDKDGVLHKNRHTWLQDHSLVFIDNPIGAGFSFTDHEDGYANNMETYSAHLFSATRQLLTLFPALQRAPLFVAGESYGGKYAPSLALELHRHKDEITVNLQGVMLGNAITEHYLSPSITEPWLFTGILDADEVQALRPHIEDYYRDRAAGKNLAAAKKWLNIGGFALRHSYQDGLYNYLHDGNPTRHTSSEEFLRKDHVVKALHAGTNEFANINVDVYQTLEPEPSNVQPKIEALLEHYKVLAYCGNLDQMVPCSISAESHRKWNWTGRQDFVAARRYTYQYDDEVTGYFKTGGRFTEVVLYGAGHMAPADKPAKMHDIIGKWTYGEGLSIWYDSAVENNSKASTVTTEASKHDSLNRTNQLTNETQGQTTEAEISNVIIDDDKEQKPVVERTTEKTQPMDTAALNGTTRSVNETKNLTETSKTPQKASEASTTEAEISNDISGEDDEPFGEPLILTPYLKQGLLEQARNASEVNSTIFLGYKSYSGYFTVNETYNSNTFFWYFPVEGGKVEDAPCVIWMQGGPGMTSIFGLTSEIGPFTTDGDELIKNPDTWLHNHSLVFIDNPVGTGFSFTDHEDGYVKDMETYSAHLYSATRQLLTLFPELQRAPLFVAGESYGGKYVPSLALELHRHKDEITVNLQGIMVGNGYVDSVMLMNFTRPFYNLGLLSPEDVTDLREIEARMNKAVVENQSTLAKEIWSTFIDEVLEKTELNQIYNFLHSRSLGQDFTPMLTLVNSDVILRAIHVGSVKNYALNSTVNGKLDPDFLTSAKWKYEELMEHYRVMRFCGQLDQMMSCGVASEFHRTFNWSGRSAFMTAKKEGFRFNNSLAVYHKTGGKLTEAVVRGAGHFATADQSAPLTAFVTRWTHRLPPFSA